MVPENRGATGERIWTTELAKYLHCDPVTLKRFARQHGLLRSARTNAARHEWVTPYAAQRIIAYIRAMQGDAYMQGRQFHERRERATAKELERRRRKREKA